MSAPAFESLTWLAADEPLRWPDESMTVLVALSGASEPTWLAFRDSGAWRDACTGDVLAGTVTYWADMPTGPMPAAQEHADRQEL